MAPSRAQLCLLMPDGSHLSVFNDDTTLEIAGGLLQLPAIHIEPDWFTADSKDTATLVLLDNEPGLGFDPAAAGTSSSSSVQQLEWEYPPQEQLGRFYLRLAPAAERLLLMAAGPQFEGVRVELPPQQVAGRGKGQRSETSFILKEVSSSSLSPATCLQGMLMIFGTTAASLSGLVALYKSLWVVGQRMQHITRSTPALPFCWPCSKCAAQQQQAAADKQQQQQPTRVLGRPGCALQCAQIQPAGNCAQLLKVHSGMLTRGTSGAMGRCGCSWGSPSRCTLWQLTS